MDELQPRNFVYMGRRWQDGKMYVAIGVLDETGYVVEREPYYLYKRVYDRAIGGVYTGASFSSTQGSGLNIAKFHDHFHDKSKILEWQAMDDYARQQQSLVKRENDKQGAAYLERIMQPLQRIYREMHDRGDHIGCTALEQAVVRQLRRSPK